MLSAVHTREKQEGSGDRSKDRKQNGRWRTSRSLFMAGLFIVGTLVAWRSTMIGRKRSEGTHRGKGRTADCPPSLRASGVGTGQGTRGKTNKGPEGGDGCQEAPGSDPGKNGPASAVQGALDANVTIGGSGVNGNLAQAEVRCINTSRPASGDGDAGLPCAAQDSAARLAGGSVRELEKPGCVGRRVVFIKSYKTGSTTLATYLTQIGSQGAQVGLGCYFMHPEADGRFSEGELESRLKDGQQFDMSVRHITPKTPYETLVKLVPGAAFLSIMRNPLDRFLSLFNYRHNLKRAYKTPEALIKAIGEGTVSKGDSRPFCNQLAWLLSGEDVDYTGIDSQEEAEKVAKKVIATASKWNVTILLTERMSDSIMVLADRMRWKMEELELRLGMHRVQNRKQPTPRKSQGYYYTCAAAADPASSKRCEEAIRRCNMVDDVLYTHYKQRFDEIFAGLVDARKTVQMLEQKPGATKLMPPLESGNYPIDCVEEEDAGSHPAEAAAAGGGGVPETEGQTYNNLHSCRGRPHR